MVWRVESEYRHISSNTAVEVWVVTDGERKFECEEEDAYWLCGMLNNLNLLIKNM